ncbi:hypothetical protein [Mariniblastus fucicola]|uniref:Leucine Rich repeats (2 copies) n=1 Tax=Mariniblastus fucicola TaxID=980251 RepID=A0A5B9P5G3_9BACT|nr:hypothetical protein [Mariniblastus fucicola]QEG21817.1 hypothetical protein MFFC18_16770 [Mariniblastus fucicola]
MLIEFRCGNYSRFDAATGQYTVCGQRMQADAEDAGMIVSCPRCKQDCEVPVPKKARGAGKRKSSDQGSPEGKPNPRKSANPGKSGAANSAAKKAPASLEEEALIAQSRQRPTAAAPKAKSQRCPKCGGVLDSRGVCGECRWVRPRFAKANQSLEEMEMEPAGMMLWFSQILSEGVPMNLLCMAANIAIPMLLSALMAFALFVMGGFMGGFFFLIMLAMLLLYIGLAYKGYQFLRDGNARLAWFQKPFWNGILAFCRSRKWKGIDAKLKNRNVVDFHGEAITDEQLIAQKEFRSAQVLDLEGTLITDKTIEQLYQLKYLQCLVVRNTEVSHLAVTRLQQSFPKLWIWH